LLTTHSRPATDRCRLRWMVGMATLVTLLSRYVMNVARLTAIRDHHLRGSAWPIVDWVRACWMLADSSVLADTAGPLTYTPLLYVALIHCSYTLYSRCVAIMTCTAYSCQARRWAAMSPVQQGDDGRARLSKATVVEQALKLADADGLEALTIRRLAADLGVTPMALYWHFRSKEDLLAGLAEAIWGEIEVVVDPALTWSEQLRGGLESLIGVLRAHPSAAQLLIDHEATNEAATQVTEAALDVLRSAGFDPEHASEIARQTLWTGIMLVLSEVGFDPGVSQAEREEAQRVKRVRFSMLPPDKYPRIVECAIPMTACDDPEFHYQMGISIFIAGVEALAAKQ